jgi:hypothetical protein
MMTRWLPPAQFGLWEVITTIVAFSAYPVGVITYWATREVARGSVVARTTLAINQVASVIGIAIYLGFALLSFDVFRSNLTAFLLAIILVPLTYWTQATGALLAGHDPTVSGYSLLLSEPTKLIVAYPLLFQFRLGVYAIIIAIAVSYLVQGLYTTYRLWPIATDRVNLSLGRKWFTLWHVPTLGTFNYLLGMADTFVISVAQSSTILAGYFQAAFQVTTVIAYGQYLSVALYPALLKRHSDRLAGEILEFSMLFALPMAVGAISLAPQILYLLRPEYASVSASLVILSVSAVLMLTSTVIDQTLTGRETADLEHTDAVAKVLRSDLMFVPKANLVFVSGYVAAVFLIGLVGRGNTSFSQLVTYWALAQLGSTLLLVLVKYERLKKRVGFVFPRSVLVYGAVAALMGAVVHFAGAVALSPTLDALDYGVRMLAMLFLGAVVYFGILVSVDPRVRGYFRAVLAPVI